MASKSLDDIKSGPAPVATANNPVAVFRGFLEKKKHQIMAALPKHISADRMIRLACTEFAKNPVLQQCTPVSVFGSLIQGAQLGLEIGVLGQAYLVPYWNKKIGAYECQLIPGYKGLIALARRSGEVTSIETHIVYEHDRFDMRLGLETSVEHVPYLEGERGAPRIVYGVAKFRDGGYHFEWMPMVEVNRIRGRSKSGNSGPWVTDYEQMVRKTLIRRMSNYLPMSIELANALAISDAIDDGRQAMLDGDIVVVGDPDTAVAPEDVHAEPQQIEQQQPQRVPPMQTRQAEPIDVPDAPDWTPSPDEIARMRAQQQDEPPARAPRRPRNGGVPLE